MGKYWSLIAVAVSIIYLAGSGAQEDVVIQSTSQTKSVAVGESVTFECIFNRDVECIWFRNGALVRVTERYTYTDVKSNGFGKDCSIKITDVQLFDFAIWKCSSLADSTGSSPPSLDNTLLSGPGNSSNVSVGISLILFSLILQLAKVFVD